METSKTPKDDLKQDPRPDWVKDLPPSKDEEILQTDRQRANKMNTAINACLEFDMAFKLMSYRVATQEMFLNRVHDLASFVVNEFKVIDENPDKNPS